MVIGAKPDLDSLVYGSGIGSGQDKVRHHRTPVSCDQTAIASLPARLFRHERRHAPQMRLDRARMAVVRLFADITSPWLDKPLSLNEAWNGVINERHENLLAPGNAAAPNAPAAAAV